jgi:hypothetical protein
MKKILFLKTINKYGDSLKAEQTALRDANAALLGDRYETRFASFADLAYFVNGSHSRIWHVTEGWDIADFDLVIFERVGDEIEKAIGAAQYLHTKHVQFFDSYLLTQGKGKLAGSFMRVGAGFSVPRTFYAAPAQCKLVFAQNAPFPFPCILKADNGRKGKDNYFVHSYEELSELLDANTHLMMLVQEFIPNEGDLRVLVFNGSAKVVIHRQGKDGSHLNNTSQGGAARLLSMQDVDAKILVGCESLSQLERLEVAGVDVIIDARTGKYYFLEVNRAPQLTSGAFIDEKVAAYAVMIHDAIAHSESIQAKDKKMIGRAEWLKLADSDKQIPARIDTGAKTSAIWASNVHVDAAGKLHYRFFDETSEYYTGRQYTTKEFQKTIVASSTGHTEERYKIKLKIVLGGRRINASFTLADRSDQVYPVLVGRNVLSGKFIVDVAIGKPLRIKEQLRTELLKRKLMEQ